LLSMILSKNPINNGPCSLDFHPQDPKLAEP
jgi:hypothetical protein